MELAVSQILVDLALITSTELWKGTQKTNSWLLRTLSVSGRDYHQLQHQLCRGELHGRNMHQGHDVAWRVQVDIFADTESSMKRRLALSYVI